jgi:hypothetical protein
MFPAAILSPGCGGLAVPEISGLARPAADVRAATVPGGHFIPEEAPAALAEFLTAT